MMTRLHTNLNVMWTLVFVATQLVRTLLYIVTQANVASLFHMSHIPCHDEQRTLNPVSFGLVTPPMTTDQKCTLQLHREVFDFRNYTSRAR